MCRHGLSGGNVSRYCCYLHHDDEKYDDAIGELWKNIADYNPKVYGYEWDNDIAPRFQLAPMGWRGYIE